MTIDQIERMGIIGAGGAGFPTHIKLRTRPDTVIMNAAECEPLVHKDMEILRHDPEKALEGFRVVIDVTGARRGIIGIKRKHREEIDSLRARINGPIDIAELDDVYPSGDEATLIYLTTGRRVAPEALPISVGCLVLNVETLYDIGAGVPVVEKFLTVAGAVAQPATIRVPVGMTMAEVLSHFTITVPDYAVRSGGLMMGTLEHDLDVPVSKRTGALIVLPANHHCITMYRRYATVHETDRLAKASCDQCSFCTELCPRFLLGQPVRPELAMRNRMFTREESTLFYPGNVSCCECNLCTMYACPESLDPRGATVMDKRMTRGQSVRSGVALQSVHPLYEYRKVPLHKLMQRLDVVRYEAEARLIDLKTNPDRVKVPLNQHAGAPAVPMVSAGDRVKRGDLIAASGGTISSVANASIDGRVTAIATTEIIIERT